ncbi:MAG TPA: alpha/beta hydrolase [Terriglobales bacterium]|jgi:pimeloyl-ACP methyl ester carboxylesterase|nr:alpha/beta hydrolase [Terriglobales bacterium]
MPAYQEQTVTVHGRKTRLCRGGKGTPLLFLHDPFCPGWLPVHDQLAVHHEVLLPIQPGFAGCEERFDQFAVMDDLLFHYLDLCEVLRIERPALVGASFGGWIAAEWALRYSASLGALILIDALGLRVPEAPAADIFGADTTALRRAIFADSTGALALESLPETPKADAIVSTLLARRSLARFAWQFPDNPRLRRYLQRVKAPTLILWGERDGVVPPAHGKAYHEGIAGSKFVTFPAAGHLPHLEVPVQGADSVIEFLRGLGN